MVTKIVGDCSGFDGVGDIRTLKHLMIDFVGYCQCMRVEM